MNPLTNVKNINKLNELEAQYGVSSTASWHQQYKDSAYIFIGGMPFELTEGDVLCVFSQYGEIVNINLVRDKKTGKSKGYCFIAYEDQRSTILAVDNFNGIKLKGRTLRVDHVSEYRKPKDDEELDDATKKLREEGCAPKTPPTSDEEELVLPMKGNERPAKKKKSKKEKKEKKKKRAPDSDDSESTSDVKIKKEKDEDYRKKKEKTKRGDDRRIVDGSEHKGRGESMRRYDDNEARSSYHSTRYEDDETKVKRREGEQKDRNGRLDREREEKPRMDKRERERERRDLDGERESERRRDREERRNDRSGEREDKRDRRDRDRERQRDSRDRDGERERDRRDRDRDRYR
ncbi:LOW QUALITY PROTEIN: RNA-binding motif protein, X-linked 2-like [Strongylocentrotus purpuratus]|uniref:RRM domain-containing protein n=1 Tax=Strongylocentrotus purpuratus TaxID=7668 RepID=A0A7M7NLK1_STRPU|nr:LOW QUALITY PROTEIN: RNA-binding motif protein, X-linked 2-like [Strongylocentrotus purpuratus]